MKTCFNRINSGRSIPTRNCKTIKVLVAQVSIVSIQADQSRQSITYSLRLNSTEVSIVSIQADQSRLTWVIFIISMIKCCFNRINSGRSIPTSVIRGLRTAYEPFQSYQFRQINPDVKEKNLNRNRKTSFNRINSGRSIPTLMYASAKKKLIGKSFNRINSGRSIPTRKNDV